jgi:hypothetical protein
MLPLASLLSALDLAPSEKAPTLTSDTQSLKEILKSQKNQQ